VAAKAFKDVFRGIAWMPGRSREEKSAKSQEREINSQADRVLRFARSTGDTVDICADREPIFTYYRVATGHPINLYGH